MEDLMHLNDEVFLKTLENQNVKEYHVKIELLDFQENTISEINGLTTTGSISISGNSSVRRTCSLTLLITDDNYDITNSNNQISINKKIRIYTGYTNNLSEYSHYGDIIWFPLGVYVVSTASSRSDLNGNTLSITCKDKMCLLNGEVAGTLPAPTVLHERLIRLDEENTKIELVPIYQIIKEAIIHLGGEAENNIIINDVPLKIKKVLRYMGNVPIYIDTNGNLVGEEVPGTTVIKPGSLAGYRWVDFTFPGELIKQTGETVVSILDSIKEVLGNYEYFYDVHGRFVFQEVKNYLNTSYTPITNLPNGSYSINLGESHNSYSFKDSNIVTAFSNAPNYANIKNDFIVWGKRQNTMGKEIPIRYHVAIDDIPSVPNEYGDIPWQVYLYEYGQEAEKLALDSGYYYRELKNEIPKLYNFEDKEWKDIDSASMDFFLDFIDSNSELGKYSINTIGRRTVAVTDDKVSALYKPSTPDFIVLEKGKEENVGLIEEFNKIGQKYYVTENFSSYTYGTFEKDAYSVIRELVFKHTTYNESITINCLPIYHLDVSTRIEVENQKSNIYGDYLISSITIPLTVEGQMSINAVRATSRL